MPLMPVSVPFCFRSIAQCFCLCGALVMLSACEPETPAPTVTAPPPIDTGAEITTEITTEITEVIPVDNDQQTGSKLDPSVSYLSQQSDPLALEPNLDILDQDSFIDKAEAGNSFNSLQPRTPDTQDEIDNAIDWIFNGQVSASQQPAATSDNSSNSLSGQDQPNVVPLTGNAITDLIDDGFDYDSLEDVFAIISKPETEDIITPPPSRFPPKKDMLTRAAILLPLSGAYQSVGTELRKAVDMAVISLAPPQFEVIYIDTAKAPAEAAYAAIAADADIIIGPVFSSHTAAIAPIAIENRIPVLSFSNNSTITNPGVWIMGQQPEHEMEAVLSYAMASLAAIENIPPEQARIAIVTNDTAYGRTLRDYSIRHLITAGAAQPAQLLLDQTVLENENRLQQSIRQFARWTKENPSPEFDMVIICGDADFTLTVAPVLVWHDLDPAKVRFVGSSQWNRADMITEPSLQGGLYATLPTDRRQRFEKVWNTYFTEPPGDLAPLGFDAVAVASLMTGDATTDNEDMANNVLLRETGFAGFSGVFRFYPDGSHRRHLEVRQINRFRSATVRPADTTF
ncbi:penicillin-binding protein activator [Alphaproteobacteria bacterium]|nr:penicillin-binding protein activator [Alphaproteobacteria bacterium]